MKTNIQKHTYILFFTSLIAITLLGNIGTALVISIALAVIFHKALKPTKQNKIYSQFLSIIFGIIIIITPFTSAIQSDKEFREEKQSIISGSSNTYIYLTKDNSPERDIELAMISTLGKNTKISTISISGNEILLEYEASDNLNNNLTRIGMNNDIIEMTQKISKMLPDPVTVINFSPQMMLVDTNGNESLKRVSLVAIKRTTWEQINWNNFYGSDLPINADSYWIHPVLQ